MARTCRRSSCPAPAADKQSRSTKRHLRVPFLFQLADSFGLPPSVTLVTNMGTRRPLPVSYCLWGEGGVGGMCFACSTSRWSTLLAPAHITSRKGSFNEKPAAWLYADRTDDRGRDHRHSGRRCTAGLPGLHDPRQDVRSDSRHERVPHLDHRGLPVG